MPCISYITADPDPVATRFVIVDTNGDGEYDEVDGDLAYRQTGDQDKIPLTSDQARHYIRLKEIGLFKAMIHVINIPLVRQYSRLFEKARAAALEGDDQSTYVYLQAARKLSLTINFPDNEQALKLQILSLKTCLAADNCSIEKSEALKEKKYLESLLDAID